LNSNNDVENAKPSTFPEVGDSSQLIDIKYTDQTRVLFILLTLNTLVSYRSVPCILELFKSKTNYAVNWVPHSTSVINWSLRRGLGVLVQAVTKPWITIIDHSIDIVAKKAIVAQGGAKWMFYHNRDLPFDRKTMSALALRYPTKSLATSSALN